MSNHLRKAGGLSPVAVALLREIGDIPANVEKPGVGGADQPKNCLSLCAHDDPAIVHANAATSARGCKLIKEAEATPASRRDDKRIKV